tara:strand:+ start:2280 stop:2696 length:417 start_codon:yes stop_codon:yes gene_type:complete
MAKYYAGQDGSLELGGVAVAKVVQWAFSANTEALEVTVLSENARTFTTGMRSASGSCTVLYYEDAPVNLINQVNQDTAADASIGSTALLKLNFGNNFFEFNAVLTSAELSCVVGEVMRVNVAFTMSGDLVNKKLKPPY